MTREKICLPALFLALTSACFFVVSTSVISPTTPPPGPELTAGNWTLTQEDGSYTCIRLIGDIYLDVAYKTSDDKNATARVHVPKEAVVVPEFSTCNFNTESGSLKSDVQTIKLSFAVHSNSWYLTVNFTNNSIFTHDESKQTVTAFHAILEYFTDSVTFPNVSSHKRLTVQNVVDQSSGIGALSLFKSDLTHCYSCNSEESTLVTPGFNISTQNLKAEAFLPNRTALMSEDICEKDRTSTTTVAPTTPSPSPGPKPTAGNWTVTQEDGRYTCIRLIGDIYMDLAYKTNEDKNATVRVHVPKRAVVVPKVSTCNFNAETGSLKSDVQTVQLKFVLRNNTWLLTVNFTNRPNLTRDDNNQTVTAYFASLDYFTDDVTFPNVSSNKRHTAKNVVDEESGDGALSLFKSDLAHCYRCNSEESTPVAPGFNISTQNLKVEAFLPNRTMLMGERICLADQQNESSDLVPIITGAALAALVLFVLIAYLVGRARAKATTYETI